MDTPYASVVLDSAESTQDEAAARFTGTPLLVVAAHQTRGRGRLDRTWVEPDRGLFASLGFVPEWPTEHWGLIPLVAGLAMRDAIHDALDVVVDLRWPNDLTVGEGKVGGILVEATDERVIVGCGVNLWWVDPLEGAGALLDTDPGPNAPSDLAAVWAGRFLERMAAVPAYWGHHEYQAACITVGRPVSFAGGSGVAIGIGADGSLLVESADGLVAVHAGEVHSTTTLPGSTEESP